MMILHIILGAKSRFTFSEQKSEVLLIFGTDHIENCEAITSSTC